MVWNSGGQGPWGKKDQEQQKPSQQEGRSKDQKPEQSVQDSLQDFLKNLGKNTTFGGGGRSPHPANTPDFLMFYNKWFAGLAFVIIVFIWLMTGFYKVEPNQQGVVLRFGKYVETTQPGLNYHLPYPIETVLTPSVTEINETEIGYDPSSSTGTLMLTGDENIVDVRFTVQWRIKDALKYLFAVENPNVAVRTVAESVIREVIGRSQIESILTTGRQKIENDVERLTQETLDSYGSGIGIERIAFKEADPPQQVIEAFRDVQAARADKERMINEATAYKNKVVPEARGEAEKLRQQAEAYKNKVVEETKGQAQRFSGIYNEYAKAKTVTQRRIYLETMESILSDKSKVILDVSSKGTVMPYFPLQGQALPQQGGRP